MLEYRVTEKSPMVLECPGRSALEAQPVVLQLRNHHNCRLCPPGSRLSVRKHLSRRPWICLSIRNRMWCWAVSPFDVHTLGLNVELELDLKTRTAATPQLELPI